MESNIHGNKTHSRRGMVAFIFLLIRGIPNEDTLKHLGFQLGAVQRREINIENAPKNLRREEPRAEP